MEMGGKLDRDDKPMEPDLFSEVSPLSWESLSHVDKDIRLHLN